MVPAEPGTIPISDALDTLGEPPPDEWMRGSARFRWSTSRVSAGCTTPPPT
jgi:hypothetical protein